MVLAIPFPMPSTFLTGAISISIKLFFGAFQVILAKELVSTESYLSSDPSKKLDFDKEMLICALAFTSMFLFTLLLLPNEINQIFYKGKREFQWITVLHTALPGMADLIGMILIYKAMKILDPSVVVLLKGTRVLFTAGLSYIFLRKKLNLNQWIGVAITCFALIPISYESYLKNKHNPSKKSKQKATGDMEQVLIGLGLALACEFVRAIRYSYEEKLMKKDKLPIGLLLVAESSFACLFSCIALCIVDALKIEPVSISLELLQNSKTIQILIGVLLVIGVICSIAGVFVTSATSSVVNAITSELRVILVFVIAVVMHAINEKRGERFSWYTWYKILGFFIMLAAMIVYKKKAGTDKLKANKIDSEPLTVEDCTIKSAV
jgi:drug/metabolite transporter (DMT)-like permease